VQRGARAGVDLGNSVEVGGGHNVECNVAPAFFLNRGLRNYFCEIGTPFSLAFSWAFFSKARAPARMFTAS